jgi:hypothetical protein
MLKERDRECNAFMLEIRDLKKELYKKSKNSMSISMPYPSYEIHSEIAK